MNGKLRVIGGLARGRKLHQVPGSSTRPITDRVKESLFNIIGADVSGSRFLDLFAGTGSVGIEALSRGAEHTLFVDNNKHAIETIKKNLRITNFVQKSTVRKVNAFTMLSDETPSKFDYIYVAPPQYKGIWKQALLSLDASPAWLSDDVWVIVQVDPKEYEEVDCHQFSEFDQRRYGSTLLIFYQRRID